MEEAKGILFALVEHEGSLKHISVKPVTREEADTYVLATLQARRYEKGVGDRDPEPVYWAPISAFQMLPTPNKKLLTEEMLAVEPECCCGDLDEEDFE